MDRTYINEDGISWRDLILKFKKWGKYLQSNLYIIVGVGFIGGIFGGSYAYFQKPVYTAEMTFVLEGSSQSGSSLVGYAGLASQFGLDMGAGNGQGVFEGENFLALMKSRLMTEKALLTEAEIDNKKISLAEYYLNFSGLRRKWEKKNSPLARVRIIPGVKPANFSRLENNVINIIHSKLLADHLYVDKKDKKSGIISIKVLSEDELFSKLFVETLTKEVSKFYIETKTKKSVNNLEILQHQTDSIKRRLNFSIIGAASALDANPNANPARQLLKVASQRNQGDAQINQAILAQLIQNLEVAKITLRAETPLIQIIDRPVLPIFKSQPDIFSAFIKWMLLSSLLIIVLLIARKIIVDL